MSRIMLAMAAAALLSAAAAGCRPDGAAMAPAGEDVKPEIAQKFCPVRPDQPIKERFSIEYEGRSIYFCCPFCHRHFKRDPKAYLKVLDEQLKAN